MDQFPFNILTFPLWWYTSGSRVVWQWTKRELRFGLHQTGLLLFARHMHEPLYGDYTKSGIILSFFLRLVLLLYKLLLFIIRAILVVVAAVLYLLLLPLVIVMIVYQFFPT